MEIQILIQAECLLVELIGIETTRSRFARGGSPDALRLSGGKPPEPAGVRRFDPSAVRQMEIQVLIQAECLLVELIGIEPTTS